MVPCSPGSHKAGRLRGVRYTLQSRRNARVEGSGTHSAPSSRRSSASCHGSILCSRVAVPQALRWRLAARRCRQESTSLCRAAQSIQYIADSVGGIGNHGAFTDRHWYRCLRFGNV